MKTTTRRKRETAGYSGPRLSENGNQLLTKRTRDRAGKKQALIQAALGLFSSKGYEVTTTREIAATAGCAEGLIHRYFQGKPGLLAAMIEHRASEEVLDLSHPSQPADSLEDEFLQLVDREIERVWESRDFFRIVIPRAIVDPSMTSVINKAMTSGALAIADRLKRHDSCTLPQDAVEALTQAVGMLGLMFGFVRPVLLGHDRLRTKKMAATVAKMLLSNRAVTAIV